MKNDMKEYTLFKLATIIELQLNADYTNNLNSCCLDSKWKVYYNS